MKPKFKIGQKVYIVKSIPPPDCLYDCQKDRKEWAIIGGWSKENYTALKIKYNTPVIITAYAHLKFHGSYLVEYFISDYISIEFDIDETNLSTSRATAI
jgi:hypothetical protein